MRSRTARGLVVGATALASLVPLGGALAASPPTAPVAPAGAELLPDLVTRAPGPVSLERRGRRTRLRLGNRVANVGAGPVELVPRRGDCDGDGDATNDRRAYQRIYFDGDGDGRYSPRRDRSAVRQRGACTRFHARHRHWHYDDFSAYELRRPGEAVVLKSSSKVSFCLMDVFEERRRAAEPRYLLCDRDVPQGISVGWADEYAEYLPGQHVDVTGLAPGLYCLRSLADPAGTIRERDETNNAAVIPVVLTHGRARVARTAACGAPSG